MSKLSERLSQLMSRFELKQGGVAELSGISQAQISRYVNGGEITGDHLIRLSKVFGVSTDFLLGENDEFNDEFAPKERLAVYAWRRGEKYEAIKIIVNDE